LLRQLVNFPSANNHQTNFAYSDTDDDDIIYVEFAECKEILNGLHTFN